MAKPDRRARWETVRGLHGRKRWAYIWEYYKLPIFGILLLLYVIGYGAYRIATDREAALYIAFVNVAVSEDTAETLTRGALASLGLDADRHEVVSYRGLTLTESDAVDRQYVYAAEMKLLAAMEAEQLDVVLMDAEARDVFVRNGYLSVFSNSNSQWADVSGSSFFQSYNAPVYLGIMGNSPRRERAEAYLHYLE